MHESAPGEQFDVKRLKIFVSLLKKPSKQRTVEELIEISSFIGVNSNILRNIEHGLNKKPISSAYLIIYYLPLYILLKTLLINCFFA